MVWHRGFGGHIGAWGTIFGGVEFQTVPSLLGFKQHFCPNSGTTSILNTFLFKAGVIPVEPWGLPDAQLFFAPPVLVPPFRHKGPFFGTGCWATFSSGKGFLGNFFTGMVLGVRNLGEPLVQFGLLGPFGSWGPFPHNFGGT